MDNTITKAVITGASSGLGYELACQLRAKDIAVIALCRRKPDIDGIIHIPTDLTSTEGVELAAKEIIERHDDVDTLVCNAGVLKADALDVISSEDIDETFAVNVTSVIKLVRDLLEVIIANHGDIVTIGSIAGTKPTPQVSVYAASKWALRGFTQSLSEQLITEDVRVMGVYPGAIETPIFGESGVGGTDKMDPASIASTIIDALSSPRRMQLSELWINRKRAGAP